MKAANDFQRIGVLLMLGVATVGVSMRLARSGASHKASADVCRLVATAQPEVRAGGEDVPLALSTPGLTPARCDPPGAGLVDSEQDAHVVQDDGIRADAAAILDAEVQSGEPTGAFVKTSRTRQDFGNPYVWFYDRKERAFLVQCARKLCGEIDVTPLVDERGAVEGLRVDHVAPDSILAARGIQAGDVLQTLNQVPFDLQMSADAWLEIAHIEELSTCVLELQRQGQPLQISFQMMDD